MRQHIVCMCIRVCRVPRREVGRLDRPTSLRGTRHIHIHTICCRITETYNNLLTYNFIKEQYVLSEDDLRIETCKSVLTI